MLQPNVCTKTYSFAYIIFYLMSLCAQTCMKISSLNKSSHSFVLIFFNQPSSTKHFPAFYCVCRISVFSLSFPVLCGCVYCLLLCDTVFLIIGKRWLVLKWCTGSLGFYLLHCYCVHACSFLYKLWALWLVYNLLNFQVRFSFALEMIM